MWPEGKTVCEDVKQFLLSVLRYMQPSIEPLNFILFVGGILLENPREAAGICKKNKLNKMVGYKINIK